MENEHAQMECEVCGGLDFHKESGHFYCNECQTQSQQVQEQVFQQDEATINKKSTRKIQKEKIQKTEDKLTSWECYNYILKGLTQELIELGANPKLTHVVKCLWMKYLHKCQVFDVKTDRLPKVSVRGSKKDLSILYNRTKRKRRRTRSLSTSTTTTLSVRRQRSTKKRALIQNQYEELSQSHTLTQDSSFMTDTLSNLKSGSESSKSCDKIHYNRYSNAELNRLMSNKHKQVHREDLDSELNCHKLTRQTMRVSFLKSPSNLTIFTLYSLLYIALLIIKDSIQLGDLLRFIKEGHLSYACFRHFFPENISDKNLNVPQRIEKLISTEYFRKRCGDMAKFLDVAKYVQTPDIIALCHRYCKELNLPDEIFFCVEKFILISKPKMTLKKLIPNYEGKAMGFIIFTLKLLFGLDGQTEEKLSNFAKIVNSNQFNFCHWLQYIGFRASIIKKYHLPSKYNNINSVLYLDYLKNQDINFKGSNRPIHGEVKDYLQVLDKLISEYDKEYLKFKPSMTPFLCYTNEIILKKPKITNKKILLQNFQNNSLEYILKPLKYVNFLGDKTLSKNGGANDNIIVENFLYLYKNMPIRHRRVQKNLVAVKISSNNDNIKNLNKSKHKSLKTTNKDVLLSNWQQGNQQRFLINQDLIKIASKIPKTLNIPKNYPIHYKPFERHWMNIPINPVSVYFSKQDMEQILKKVHFSFGMVLKECARIITQEERDVFSELLMTELYLVYCVKFGCKNTNKWPNEIKNLVDQAVKLW